MSLESLKTITPSIDFKVSTPDSSTYNITSVDTSANAPELSYWNNNQGVEELDLSNYITTDTSQTQIQTIETKQKYDEYINQIINSATKEIEIYNNLKNETQKELDYINELIDKIKSNNNMTTPTSYNGIYEETVIANNLDEITKELTEYETYDELIAYKNQLREYIVTIESAIYKTEQSIQTANYDYLPLLKDYQNYNFKEIDVNDLSNCLEYTYDTWGYECTETISYTQYCNLYGKVSPFEFYKTVKQTNPNASISGISNFDNFENLLLAISLNPDLEKTYNYIYETEGIEKATEYLSNIEDQINQYAGQAKANEFLNSLEINEDGTYNCNFLTSTNQAKVTLKGLFDGVENFGAGISAWFEGSNIYSADEYEAMYILQALSSNEDFLNFLDDNYQISQSIGNMLPSMAISALTMNPTAGIISLGISAGGNSYHSALVEGNDRLTSILYGIASGASEALLEKYLGAIPGLGEVEVTSFKTWLKAAGQEGLEEFIQTHFSAGLDQGILGKEIDYNQLFEEALQSGAYGSITGGIMNGPGLVGSTVNKSFVNNTLTNQTLVATEFNTGELKFVSLFNKRVNRAPQNQTNNLTREQMDWVNRINNMLKNTGQVSINLKNTKSITSEMLRHITDLSRISVRMDLSLSDFQGNYMPKYEKSKYIERVTYTGNEAYSILRKIEEIESKVDMSLPITMRAKQIYEIIASEIPVMRSRPTKNHYLVSQSLRGIVSNNIVGEAGLICAGYSSLFREICTRCNIQCDYIRGRAVIDLLTGQGGGHAWNVFIDENNRPIPVDVTWKASGDSDWFGGSQKFQESHIADSDEIFKNYMTPANIIQTKYDMLSKIISTMDQYHGEGSGLRALREYVDSGNANKITRQNGARNLLQYLNRNDIINYINSQSSGIVTEPLSDKTKIIENILSTMIKYYGEGSGFDALQQYLRTGNPNVITRENGARASLQHISKGEIAEYLTSKMSTIQNIISAMDQYHGSGSGVEALRRYIKYGEKNVITRKNGARASLENVSVVEIKEYIKLLNL